MSESANERSAGPVGSAREVRECRSCAFWKRHSAESTVGLCRQALPRNEAWTTDAWDMCSDYTLNPSLQGAGHLVDRTLDGVVQIQNKQEE